MRQETDNYEDAVRIIIRGVRGEYYTQKLIKSGIRALIAVAVAVAVNVALCFILHNPVLMGGLPVFLSLAMIFVVPFIINLSARKNVLNESYFKDKTKEEVIGIANEHLREEYRYETRPRKWVCPACGKKHKRRERRCSCGADRPGNKQSCTNRWLSSEKNE